MMLEKTARWWYHQYKSCTIEWNTVFKNLIRVYTCNLKFHGQCYLNIRIECDVTTPVLCLTVIKTAHKTCFSQIFNHSALRCCRFWIYMWMSHFSQWLHSGLPIGHWWYERVDWLLCGFLSMVCWNGFHAARVALQRWIFFNTLTHRGTYKCLSFIMLWCGVFKAGFLVGASLTFR